MKIIKYKKLKSNEYEIELSGDLKIKLYDDVIIKYNLLLEKNISDNRLNEIIKYNDSLDAYYLVIKYLSRKLRSEKELIEYLKKKKYNDEVIENTILKVKANGYLNREVFVKSYINDKYSFSNDGPLKIKNDLIKLGFIEEEFDRFLNQDFSLKIDKIITKKIKSNHKLSNTMLKQNISSYLINLGYSKEMFDKKLDCINICNSDFIRKDYLKLLNKYSKKYCGNELKYYLKNKLYQKGYSNEEIEDVLNENIL